MLNTYTSRILHHLFYYLHCNCSIQDKLSHEQSGTLCVLLAGNHSKQHGTKYTKDDMSNHQDLVCAAGRKATNSMSAGEQLTTQALHSVCQVHMSSNLEEGSRGKGDKAMWGPRELWGGERRGGGGGGTQGGGDQGGGRGCRFELWGGGGGRKAGKGCRINLGFGLGESSSGGQLSGCSKHDRVCHLKRPKFPFAHGFRPQLQASQVGPVGSNACLPAQLQSCQHLQHSSA